ncbi:hypothetical protein BDP27DRAFT_1327454 [Rhodocollybia butyracea]|uniref:Uncharacterized protein n=1 Tax=Rhodocollybia butyracea TaxID=206335 RepID=A0A9P5PRZ0_9AGAR|nr:hypothetical protein BDP27DRAFT_1327454 [Rhodocollybia butyracea]
MAITPSQKASISSVIENILTAVAVPPNRQGKAGEIVGGTGIGTGRGRKRVLSGMFLILLDKVDWKEYYDIIPNPRALRPIRDSLAENKYTDPLEVYTDLSLVFWNALFYNERDSQISKDAAVLKKLLETEWARRPDLPQPRSHSPPLGSAQKAFPEVEAEERKKEEERQRLEEEAKLQLKREEDQRQTRSAEPQIFQAPQPSQSELNPQSSVLETIDMDENKSDADTDTEHETDASFNAGMDDEVQVKDSLDVDSDTIVHHLEDSLPRWPGFGDQGWLTEGNTELYSGIFHAVKGHKDAIGNRLAIVFDVIPDTLDGPTGMKNSISLKAIEARIKSKSYPNPISFDQDMMLLFEKGRRWWEPTQTNISFKSAPSGKPISTYGSSREEFAKVLILQRLYQALTSPYPPERPNAGLGSLYSSETNFASRRVAPGRLDTNLPSNVTTSGVEDQSIVVSGTKQMHIIMKDRVFLDKVEYKGWTIRVGDWVHLANGSDATAQGGGGAGRPIVAQVWKVWRMQGDSPGQFGITACWYYRPEETFHSPRRVFWENEVFKSTQFASHPLTDILEPIFVQSTRDHVLGRPRGVLAEGQRGWYPGWPLYVCNSRYSYTRGCRAFRCGQTGNSILLGASTKPAFVPIKDWNSCLSPEVSSISDKYHQPSNLSKSTRQLVYPFERTVYPKRRASSLLNGGGPGGFAEDGSGTGPTKGDWSGSTDVAGSKVNGFQQSINAQSYSPYYQYTSQVLASTPIKPSKPDRTLTVHASAQGTQHDLSRLPKETTQHFTRDPSTGSLLWFPSPPVNVSGRVDSSLISTSGYNGSGVGHSIAYLHWKATKTKGKKGSALEEFEKLEDEANLLGKRKAEEEVNGMDCDNDSSGSILRSGISKKQKISRTTMIETLGGVLKSL